MKRIALSIILCVALASPAVADQLALWVTGPDASILEYFAYEQPFSWQLNPCPWNEWDSNMNDGMKSFAQFLTSYDIDPSGGSVCVTDSNTLFSYIDMLTMPLPGEPGWTTSGSTAYDADLAGRVTFARYLAQYLNTYPYLP